MAIRFVEIHPSPAEGDKLNCEWVVLENVGKTAFQTRGCGMTVGMRGSSKKTMLGIIDPGFLLSPGERVRLLTGHPGKEHDPPPPEDGGVKNYYLLLPKAYLRGAGTVLTLTLRGMPICKGEHDPATSDGVAAVPAKAG